jgi:hypothetical protein
MVAARDGLFYFLTVPEPPARSLALALACSVLFGLVIARLPPGLGRD